MRCEDLRRRVTVLRGRREQLMSSHAQAKQRLEELDQYRQDCEKAQAIIQFVAKQTQDQLEYRISELTSCALEAVFPKPYRLRVRFEQKRGRTECALVFVSPSGEEVAPMDATGFGPVDVASFALRLTMLTIQKPKKRPLIILDEPFKFVSKDLLSRVAELLHELTEKMGIMFIIITHEDRLIWDGDTVFRVAQKDGESFIVDEDTNSKQYAVSEKAKKKDTMEDWEW